MFASQLVFDPCSYSLNRSMFGKMVHLPLAGCNLDYLRCRIANVTLAASKSSARSRLA